VTLPDRIVDAGGQGVFLFFALTGYLLFWPFAQRAFGNGRPISLRTYARNRALRILPLYYAVVVVLMILQENGSSFSQWWKFLTFSENFFTSSVGTVDGPIWSLVVEVQFYILLPFLAYGLVKLSGRSRVRAAAILVVLAIPSVALFWLKVHRLGRLDLRWNLSFPVTFFNFVPGMLLALLRGWLAERPPTRSPPSDLLIGGGFALWLSAAVDPTKWGQLLLAVGSFTMLAAVVLPVRDGVLLRVLDARILGIVGVVSYSLYLWHFPILRFLHEQVGIDYPALLPLAFVVCVPAAIASYYVIERPFLGLRRRWGSTTASSAPAAGVVAEAQPEAVVTVEAY
jgi:peptidoglycan/LPS O-acetylase OafA/YrhL